MKSEVVVIGAGIVGLATALQVLESRPGSRVVVLEKELEIGSHQTGHNSGVIHSGLYYKPESLKAKLCRDGYKRLIEFCQTEEVPFDICGKIVVATEESEVGALRELEARGTANGLVAMRRINAAEIREYEPHVVGVEGLLVPETGIVDYTAVCEKYVRRIQKAGGEVLVDQRVIDISNSYDCANVVTQHDSWESKIVVTCGGLQSDRIARLTVEDLDVRIIPFRGEYFTLRDEAQQLINNLVYPVPNANFPFLGVHFTRMIGGGIECGPNAVLALAREGYRKVDFNAADTWETITWPGFHKIAKKYWKTGAGEYYRSFSKKAFTRALQKLVPEISETDLVPALAGVRAQACDRTGGLLDDFSIRTVDRVINVCNAPSPAATASLAIGNQIAHEVISRLG